jgi:peptidoglycan L-alanyl-D-glutamate endopeptidase CwlK
VRQLLELADEGVRRVHRDAADKVRRLQPVPGEAEAKGMHARAERGITMPIFSNRSKLALATCHPDLQRVLTEAIKHIDFTVLEGHRGKDAQNAAFAGGFSQLKWPKGKHNHPDYPEDEVSEPIARAVDIAPYPISWSDTERFVLFAGFILGIASQLGVGLRWGGDWDRDTQVKDERFRDWGHFELI